MTTDSELNKENIEEIDREVELEGEVEADYETPAADELKKKEYTQKADQIWSRVQALGLSAKHPVVLDIYDHLVSGRAKRAEAKLDKLADTITNEQVELRLAERGISTEGKKTDAQMSESRYKDLALRYGVDPSSLSPGERAEYLRLRQERY